MDWSSVALIVGLLSVALCIFFGLRGFRKEINKNLSEIEINTRPVGDMKDKIITMSNTIEKIWDSIPRSGGQTVERNFEKLGKVKITAEPHATETRYFVVIQKPILKEGFLIKTGKETEFLKKELEVFSRETLISILSPHRMRIRLPSTDPKICTKFMTFLLNWLNTTYVQSLDKMKEFEEPI